MTSQVAFLTPSFYGDYDHCYLLVESLEKFVIGDYEHFIVVDRADYPLFRGLESSRTKVLLKEDFLPAWVLPIRIPLPQKDRYFRPSLKSLPLRGWAVQQLVKLQVCAGLSHEHAILVDSDVFLAKTFRLDDFVQDGLSPLYAKSGVIDKSMPTHLAWLKTAAQVLGVESPAYPGDDFVTPCNFWRPEVVREMRSSIERRAGHDWMTVVARNWNFCEPVVYGSFVQSRGFEACGHRLVDSPLCYSFWDQRAVEQGELEAFLDAMPAESIAVNIQSKTKLPKDAYRNLVNGIIAAAGDEEPPLRS